ncbi:MAG: hypothetical protein OXC65_01330 [Thiotrichales bacterium]|nr:hypothetical protein [Thiotrichales bacterium]
MAIAASLGLTGCGGSSDNEQDETMNLPAGDPPAKTAMSADVELSDAQKAALKAELKDSGDSETLKDGDVRVGVTFSCTSDDPCTITVSNSLGTIVATAHSTTSGTVTGAATGLEAPAIPAASGVSGAALRGQLLDASPVADLVNGENNAELGTAGFPTDTNELKDPKDGDTKFTKSDTAPAALDGWTGETWTTGNQIIVRYANQNIESAEGTFRSQFGDKDGGAGDEITNADTVGDNEGRQTEWDWDLAESDEFPTGAREETYRQGVSFKGTYGGVEGEFTCMTEPCELALNDDGEIAPDDGTDGVTSVWKFTADNEGAAVSYDKADADYLAFGWWRQSVGTNHSGINGFKVLYSGNSPLEDDDVADISGKATYNGHAAGNYVKGVKDGTSVANEGGEFVANVKLVADFESTDEESKITATINKFRDASGDLGSWEVGLATAETAAVHATADITFVTAERSGAAGSKAWEIAAGGGGFYGSTANNAQPTGVAGWFHATTNDSDASTLGNTAGSWQDGDVAVAGAFAATR